MTLQQLRSVLSVALAGILLAAWLGPLDTRAIENVDDGFKKALLSFGTARALNAAVSLVQSTTFSATPLGLGVSISPGQVLRPINELIAQFADLMLAASIAFGVIKVLIAIGSSWWISLALSIAAGGWVFAKWQSGQAPHFLSRCLLGLLFIRFAIPVVFVATTAISERFLAEDYSTSQKALEINTAKLVQEASPGDAPAASDGWWGGIKDKFGSADGIKKWMADKVSPPPPSSLAQNDSSIGARVAGLKSFATELTGHIVKIIVVFLLQTLVIPLLLLWMVYKFMRLLVLRASPSF